MHYKNGREAHNGDSVVLMTGYPKKRPIAGVLYDATAGNNACNGSLAPFGGGSHIRPNLADCYHLDDFAAAIPNEIPDTSLPEAPAEPSTESATLEAAAAGGTEGM